MRTAVVGAMALVVVVTGCGTDDGADSGETLGEVLGHPSPDDPEAMQAQFEEEQREIEEHIAACMAEEGFDYEPRDRIVDHVVSDPRRDMDHDEFVEEYGYGLTTIDPADHVVEQQVDDPMQERLQAMDDVEREAYLEALQGEMPEPDPHTDEPVQHGPGGCAGEAHEAVRGAQERVWQELGDELEELFERVQSDPRIVEAQTGWRTCMQDSGWEFTDPTEPTQHIIEQHQELLGQPTVGELPEAAGELEAGEEPAVDFEPQAPPEPDPDALAELQAEELELAAIDYDCQVEHFGADHELYRDVHEEYEREFVDEHRDVLQKFTDG